MLDKYGIKTDSISTEYKLGAIKDHRYGPIYDLKQIGIKIAAAIRTGLKAIGIESKTENGKIQYL